MGFHGRNSHKANRHLKKKTIVNVVLHPRSRKLSNCMYVVRASAA